MLYKAFVRFFVCIYIFGLLAYPGHTQNWYQYADFPGTERDDGATFTIGSKSYCFSGLETGWNCTANGYAFDHNLDTWGNMQGLPSGRERQYALAFAGNGIGYLLGGIDCSNTALNDFLCYNPVQDSWNPLPDFPAPGRYGMSCFVLQNKVYVIGGKLSNGTVLDEVWEYNLLTGQWVQKNNAPVAMWRGSAFSIDSIGYMALGVNNLLYNHYLFRYLPSSDSWSQVASVFFPALTYSGIAIVGQKACFYGGVDSLGVISTNLRVYHPADTGILILPGIPSFPRKGGMAFSSANAFYYATGVSDLQRTREIWKYTGFMDLEENHTEAATLRVFPNPATDYLQLDIPDKEIVIDRVCIMNTCGQPLIDEAFYKGTINIESLPNGLYLIRYTHEGSSASAKFMVRRD